MDFTFRVLVFRYVMPCHCYLQLTYPPMHHATALNFNENGSDEIIGAIYCSFVSSLQSRMDTAHAKGRVGESFGHSLNHWVSRVGDDLSRDCEDRGQGVVSGVKKGRRRRGLGRTTLPCSAFFSPSGIPRQRKKAWNDVQMNINVGELWGICSDSVFWSNPILTSKRGHFRR